jgi:hypothetical protein
MDERERIASMESKRTCPECHLIFDAELPPNGILVCPLCNCAFSALPPAAPTPAFVSPLPATSGRQVLRGVAAVGAVLFLAGGLGYAYYLMGGIDHKATEGPHPVPSEPFSTELPEPVEVIPILPAEPKPQAPVLQPKPMLPKPHAPVLQPKPIFRVNSFFQRPQPKPAVIPEEVPRPLTLPERVNRAIDRGVALLRARHAEPKQYCNYLGLVGLTLLECGSAADDPSIRQIVALIRARERLITQTYELTLAILFLDRLGEARDRDLIRSFGQRLLWGQQGCGAWTYTCLMNNGRGPAARTPDGLPVIGPLMNWPNTPPGGSRPWFAYRGDNSNTQFAILGLWVAQRHGVPAGSALLATAQYFRTTQTSDGSWAYNPNAQNYRDSNTCAGLMSLAMRYGAIGGQGRDIRPQQAIQVHDAAVDKGLRYLAQALDKITLEGKGIGGVDARDPLYFLWSLERMAVIYDLKKIGEREWYPWAAELLVESQWPDGSWPGNPVGTCFALLVLKRSNFAKDLQLAVQEPPSRPNPDLSGPVILQGPDAQLGQLGKSQAPAPLVGSANRTIPSPPLGPPVTRTPTDK